MCGLPGFSLSSHHLLFSPSFSLFFFLSVFFSLCFSFFLSLSLFLLPSLYFSLLFSPYLYLRLLIFICLSLSFLFPLILSFCLSFLSFLLSRFGSLSFPCSSFLSFLLYSLFLPLQFDVLVRPVCSRASRKR